MISRISLLKCKEGVSEEAFREGMMGEVRDVIAGMPQLRKCEIDFVTDRQQRSHLGRGAIDIDGFIEMGLESAHAEVDMNDYQVPKKLKKTDVSKEACLSCHDQAEVAAATADLTVLTDDNGLTVNPHELPGNSEHDKLVCAKCHTMHEEATPDENAADACASCHHAGVYECHTCHS